MAGIGIARHSRQLDSAPRQAACNVRAASEGVGSRRGGGEGLTVGNAKLECQLLSWAGHAITDDDDDDESKEERNHRPWTCPAKTLVMCHAPFGTQCRWGMFESI